ncbi:hypothetical protein Y032_0108g69 [Ancylostoma ceylanicum]|uniref:Uncharacterized protein n=1 Tax=Ancylostoma ceylanicum TaxID=53326 RepID=A0A016TFC1_9BILA|nr:hypothetical protein Y032_0108g69 [Ancylostoma ceylanicum]
MHAAPGRSPMDAIFEIGRKFSFQNPGYCEGKGMVSKLIIRMGACGAVVRGSLRSHTVYGSIPPTAKQAIPPGSVNWYQRRLG